MDYPRVSVVTRAFNAEKYVKEALESILHQDYPGEIELLICYDRGSSDNTLRAIESEVMRRSVNRPIKLIKHEHTSPFRALSIYGFSSFTGQYVAFLDHDNLLPSDYIRKLVEGAISRNLEFVFTRAHIVDGTGKDLAKNLFTIPNDYRSVRRIVLRNYIDLNTMFIRSDRLRRIAQELSTLNDKFYDWVHEDWLIGMMALKQGKVEHFGDLEMYYRVHESNLAYSMYIGDSRRLHFSNLWRDFKTLIAFTYLQERNLTFVEKLFLHFALLEKLVLFFVLKWLIPDRGFSSMYRLFASRVQFIERRL